MCATSHIKQRLQCWRPHLIWLLLRRLLSEVFWWNVWKGCTLENLRHTVPIVELHFTWYTMFTSIKTMQLKQWNRKVCCKSKAGKGHQDILSTRRRYLKSYLQQLRLRNSEDQRTQTSAKCHLESNSYSLVLDVAGFVLPWHTRSCRELWMSEVLAFLENLWSRY